MECFTILNSENNCSSMDSHNRKIWADISSSISIEIETDWQIGFGQIKEVNNMN